MRRRARRRASDSAAAGARGALPDKYIPAGDEGLGVGRDPDRQLGSMKEEAEGDTRPKYVARAKR
jgi:hypothetical protein